MSKKLVDIIIPAYKAHNTIFQVLSSIAMQSMAQDIQVTVVNDCCPEGSYQSIINRFKGFLDIKEFKLSKNGGPGTARRMGMMSTNAPYIMFCDADDSLSAPYVVKILYNNIVNNPDEGIIVSNFLEESGDNQYVTHEADRVWVFSKIYRRSFLKQHNIEFTDLRANEDTCFNRKILITYNNLNKTFMSVNTVTYVWRTTNPNSITRSNNHQYTYDQSTYGFVKGMIEAFDWMDKQKIDKRIIKQELYSCMIFLYFSYCDIATELEFLQYQNLEFIKEFYHKVFKKYNFKWETDPDFVTQYEENMSSLTSSTHFKFKMFMANPTITQWMEFIDKSPYNELDIIKLWNNMPKELKEQNIKSGVVPADFYKFR